MKARLVGITEHVRTQRASGAQMDQGATHEYACRACKRSFSLLGRTRRAWFAFGIVVGLACIPLAAVLDGVETIVFGAMGVIAALFCAGVLLRDMSLRRRSRE